MKQVRLISVIFSGFLSFNALANDQCQPHPKEQWMPKSELKKMLEEYGYQVKTLSVEDNCYKMDGLTAEGVATEIYFDTVTGEAVKSSTEEEEGDQ